MKPSSTPASRTPAKKTSARLKLKPEPANNLAKLNPKLAREWHPTKNGDLKPKNVRIGSNKPIWWRCNKGHEWQQDVFKRNAGAGCPFCANRKVLQGYNDLATTHPELLDEWDYQRNTLDPTEITAGISHKAHWRCTECSFEWQAVIGSRSRGHGCPNCAGRVVIKGQNDLKTKSKDTLRFWDFRKNGDLKPASLSPGSKKVVWWRDRRCGHSWQRSIAAQTASGICPVCLSLRKVSFPEKAIAFYLAQAIDIRENYLFNKGSEHELDVFIPSRMVGIEYDGAAWHHKEQDEEKNRLCLKTGIKLIRIRERGLPRLTDRLSYNLTVNPHDGRHLARSIKYVFRLLKLGPVDVDFARDREQILQYMKKGI